MKQEVLRRKLAEFLGNDRFQRLVKDLRQLKRFRHWQEQRWQDFITRHPDLAVDFPELQVALRICEVHGGKLHHGAATVFDASRLLRNRHQRERDRLFPHSGSQLIDAQPDARQSHKTRVWYCEECRVAEQAWKEQLPSLPTLSDIHLHYEEFPHPSISASELSRALQVVVESEQLPDKRILSVRPYPDGYLVISTGEQRAPLAGRGYRALLRKDAHDWVVVEVSSWFS